MITGSAVKLLLLMAACAVAVQAQRIVYTKTFPGSAPPYAKITLVKSGELTYQEDPNEPEPMKVQLEESAVEAIFGLAAKLDHFTRKLESGLKVANTGLKSYRWEENGSATEVRYNHSNDENARALQQWFENITESERILTELERTYKYDRLGVNEIVERLQVAYMQKRLVAPGQFTPILDRIAKNEALLNMARERAAALSEVFKSVSRAQ